MEAGSFKCEKIIFVLRDNSEKEDPMPIYSSNTSLFHRLARCIRAVQNDVGVCNWLNIEIFIVQSLLKNIIFCPCRYNKRIFPTP